ncbi:hypothetical protein [Erythrobacter sp. WG]|uniref:hypothetical protein n=1 Tax=Erythrobacter sp. WG TaxID=2985510 RepID=UPI00226FF18E|nr:hypothetical protein [Erythrobacter sp. WG]MCX9147352.1 hypothetical protein [Erythrobacter sp. WG]
MPSTTLETFAAWSNYHLTIGDQPGPGQPPAMTVKQQRRLHCADVADLAVEETMSQTSALLMEALHDIAKMRSEQGPLNPVPGPFASGVVGRGWSFAPLIGTPTSQIVADGLSWFRMLPDELRPAQGPARGATLCVCGGGTRLRELVTWAEREGHSIITSGTHLGPTIAGGFGTASHGSRLGHGGLQNLVRGMHIVTGEGDHVFLQHPDFPVLGDAAIASLVAEVRADGGPARPVACRAITDAAHFENALVHLGCMGIVSAVVVELTPKEDLAVMAWKHPIDAAWLERIAKGDFQGIADQMNADGREPLFYELTIDPQPGPDSRGGGGEAGSELATHLLYFAAEGTAPLSMPGRRPVPADAVVSLAKNLFALSPDKGPHDFLGDPLEGDPDPDILAALRTLLQGASSIFEEYLAQGGFAAPAQPFDPAQAIRRGSWGEIHGDEITGAVPGALYNASFAIPLADVPAAVPAIRKAVAGLSPSFVFTLRFLKNPAGSLAFTRFPECAVIEIDGLSPLICDIVLAVFRKLGPVDPRLERGLQKLRDTLPTAASLVRKALDAAGIEHSLHWAKLGGLDAAKVAADFGPRPDQPSKIAAWQATRETLLRDPVARDMFRNGAAVRYGLVPGLPGEDLPA